nr:hypothetical protein [Candidatus Sigynarchaeota archaeon]
GLAFDTSLRSDAAPLGGLAGAVCDSGADVKFMRDPTRGGLAGVLADLAEQGFPRYHGGFSYTKKVEIPPDAKKVVLKIGNTTDCIEVKVNGILVDVAWHSWNVDITRSLKAGETNTIELVYYGIAQNMLQTNIKPQGLIGTVSLEISK